MQDLQGLAETLAGRSVPEAFERAVERYAECIAVSDGVDYTYRQLNNAANALARQIAERDSPNAAVVTTLFPMSMGAITAYFAAMKTGKICAPLDTAFPRDRLAAQFADSRAALMVTSPAYADLARSFAPQVLALESPAVEPSSANLNVEITPEMGSSITYTSGSTGAPKGVLTRHRLWVDGMKQTILGTLAAQGPSALDRSPGHAVLLGNYMALAICLTLGLRVIPFSVADDGLDTLAERLRAYRVLYFHAIPTPFRRFCALLAPDATFPDVQYISMTGEAVHARDVDLFKRHFPKECKLHIMFGTTEAGILAERIVTHDTEVEDGFIAAGHPPPNVEVRLYREDGQAIPPGAAGETGEAAMGEGEIGEIVARGREMPAEYWGQPELTAACFKRDPNDPELKTYFTGDLGRWMPNGMLMPIGRGDSQVKVRGNRVELGDVEAALRRIEGIQDCVVAAREFSTGAGATDRFLAAYYVLDRGARVLHTARSLRRLLAEILPDYMVPTTAMAMEELPFLPNGKVNRRALPDPPPLESDFEYEAPRTEMEKQVAAAWIAALNVPNIGLRDNFFDLGGTSLTAMEAIAALKKGTGVKFKPRDMAGLTLGQVAAIYEKKSASRWRAGLRRVARENA